MPFKINDHVIDPSATYEPKLVCAIFKRNRSTLVNWIKNGRLAHPKYPFGKTSTRAPHFWFGIDLLKCHFGNDFKGECKK